MNANQSHPAPIQGEGFEEFRYPGREKKHGAEKENRKAIPFVHPWGLVTASLQLVVWSAVAWPLRGPEVQIQVQATNKELKQPFVAETPCGKWSPFGLHVSCIPKPNHLGLPDLTAPGPGPSVLPWLRQLLQLRRLQERSPVYASKSPGVGKPGTPLRRFGRVFGGVGSKGTPRRGVGRFFGSPF